MPFVDDDYAELIAAANGGAVIAQAAVQAEGLENDRQCIWAFRKILLAHRD